MNSPATLLIVDDQPENLAALGDLLEPHYRVIAATTGRRALQLAVSESPPDLILLDVTMPEMDGYQMLGHLRADPATHDIPVIFVTGRDAELDEEHGLKLGAADYITKPIRPAIVLARVLTQLENKQARDLLKNQNTWLAAEVERRMHDNELSQDASLHALASLAETRDKDTGNHLSRTQSYVALLVEALGQQPDYAAQMPWGQPKLIVRAAPLHDIGKVGIPDHILNKPGKLTAEEFSIMQTHSRMGGEAIDVAISRVVEADHSPLAGDRTGLSFLVVASMIARWHHERWDGKGYPDALVGGAIPLPARIMAVADVYDALISPRIYKPALPHTEAVAIIRAGRCAQFDPGLVDVFEGLHERFEEIAHRFGDSD
ncbi:MAG: response regulator [Comamonadaceae bacterium]|nr:response regulator [Comamonadaceae bacterium]